MYHEARGVTAAGSYRAQARLKEQNKEREEKERQQRDKERQQRDKDREAQRRKDREAQERDREQRQKDRDRLERCAAWALDVICVIRRQCGSPAFATKSNRADKSEPL